MSKLNKEFKTEVDKSFKEGDYVLKKTVVRIIILIAILMFIGAASNLLHKKFVEKQQIKIERENFKESVAYTEQAASFLAKSYKEYKEAETKDEKKAIKEYVIMRYPNLDIDSIDNDDLRAFYEKCLN